VTANRQRLVVWGLCGALVVSLAGAPPPAAAQQPPASQDRTRQQRDELERIRRERLDLERKARELKSTVHNLSEERSNLDRQADATARVVLTLDRQILSLADEEADATAILVTAQDELSVKRAILRYRVREIYKRGGMHSLEAMLSANSFGELLARYKYLHLVALRDRALVTRVAMLGDQIAVQRTSLVKLRNETEQSRLEKTDEERRLRTLEQQRGRSLARAEEQQQQVAARLAQIARDEARLSAVLASLDEARRRAESRPGAAPPAGSTLSTRDLGRLDWPVEGTILYRFGRQVNPNNTTIRWNGIGIGAALGTPVKAVSSGTVEYAERMGTYGLMVIVNHGANDYSLYGSLASAGVVKGARIAKGQVIGTVGTSDPDLDPHLHFEIRPNGRAVDPFDWLRTNR
jgi:septal ring factor EnvC (AmiA/AmiB activator)